MSGKGLIFAFSTNLSLFSSPLSYPLLSNHFFLSNLAKKALVGHLQEEDLDAWTKEVQTYDSVSRLEQFHTTLLLRIKKGIADADELC